MTEKALEGLRVGILATNGVQETELVEPRKALEEAGARTTLIAPNTGTIQASKHGAKTKEFHGFIKGRSNDTCTQTAANWPNAI